MESPNPNIADHGLIGDLQTAALVTTDGVLDWFCCPRFDSPSVFASLLDAERGGFYRVAPDRDDYVTRQLYLPDTAVLITRFMTPDGVGEVHDFMPVVEGPATNRHRLVRNIRVVRGVMPFAIEIQPRFDYGRKRHELEAFDHGGVFRSEDLELTAHAIAPAGSRWSATVTGCGGPGPCGRASPGEWSWSRWAARPGSCPPRRRSGWRMTRRGSGAAGWAGRATAAAGARWSVVRPSP